MLLTANSIQVLETRYLRRDSDGKITESPLDLFQRVGRFVAGREKDKKHWEKKFMDLMVGLRFLPNTPTLVNAGLKNGQLSACFVLPVESSVEGVFSALKNSALIHHSGGGTGFSFSRLTALVAGVPSVMTVFDKATDAIKQAGVRRGANMGVLHVEHPEILEFISLKESGSSFQNFNISVGITDHFMEGVLGGDTGAGRLFQKICHAAWLSGDPGLVFLDRMNRFNPTPSLGVFEATNPCGEQPLLPYESCNLGSLNVSKYVVSGKMNWKRLGQDVCTAVRFLDNIIDLNSYPILETKQITLKNRKIGLGVMGWADTLLLLGLRYDSTEARDMGSQLMGFIDSTGKEVSAELAEERGAFHGFSKSLWKKLGYPKLRNATVSTVAPTGTISIIAGCSSGIEPIFSAQIERKVLDGQTLYEEHPWFKEFGQGFKGMDSPWQIASEISIPGHIEMQAAFQRHSDSAVSKTINLKADATVSDISEAYILAYRLGCKGITVYRDGSRSSQVLNKVICRTC